MTTQKRPPNLWRPGQTGNPKGRPPGVSEITRLRESIAKHVPSILDQLVTAAQGGDVQAARLILERVLPPVKATEQAVALQLPDGGTLTAKANAVLSAVALGDLAPGQGSQLITAIGALARVTEIDDLTQRIEKLENQHAN